MLISMFAIRPLNKLVTISDCISHWSRCRSCFAIRPSYRYAADYSVAQFASANTYYYNWNGIIDNNAISCGGEIESISVISIRVAHFGFQ